MREALFSWRNGAFECFILFPFSRFVEFGGVTIRHHGFLAKSAVGFCGVLRVKRYFLICVSDGFSFVVRAVFALV